MANIDLLHLAPRFDAKWELDPATGCWLWTAGFSSGGYGSVGVRENGKWRMERAHRAAWMLYRGPIPKGQHVLHKCDTPACVNPEHLFLGDQAANNQDMTAKGRRADTNGSANPNARLTETEVLEIRTLRGSRRQIDIAADFAIPQAHVSAIQLGKRWAHLQESP